MKDQPIIRSLLEVDFYKFTMGLVVWRLWRDVPVTFAFKNRTKRVRLAEIIQEEDLRAELDHIRTLRFAEDEIAYLRTLKVFPEEFLQFLFTVELPPYSLRIVDGSFELTFSGSWSITIWWETLALSVINELYYRAILEKMTDAGREAVFESGRRRLAEKIAILKAQPEIVFCEFGNRRAFSRKWQEYVVMTLARELPRTQFIGTSNVYLAKLFGLRPIGTFAHEMFMIYSGIMHGSDDEIRSSHNRVLQDWWKEFGESLSVALTDTFGSKFFFEDMTVEQARIWRGLRQDSGDPIEFGEKAIEFYKRHLIDPRTKVIVFSDGLDVEAIVKIWEHFKDRIKIVFGWGTNLTNDLGFPALSLVIKAVEANGFGTVKLSDNPAKAIGDLEDIQRFRQIFGYNDSRKYVECKY